MNPSVSEKESYVHGFNAGYLLAVFIPKLASVLIKNFTSTDPYGRALNDGIKYAEKELFTNRERILKADRRNRQNQELGKDF